MDGTQGVTTFDPKTTVETLLAGTTRRLQRAGRAVIIEGGTVPP